MKDKIELVAAKAADAELIHKMQMEAFMPLYEKYHDDETSPAKESLEKVLWRITEQDSDYFIICLAPDMHSADAYASSRGGHLPEGKAAGAVRIVRDRKQDNVRWISPLFVLPELQNRGIAQKAIRRVFELYPETAVWKLETILQEERNCYLYEKCGFVRAGNEQAVNERLTLIEYRLER